MSSVPCNLLYNLLHKVNTNNVTVTSMLKAAAADPPTIDSVPIHAAQIKGRGYLTLFCSSNPPWDVHIVHSIG